MSCAICKIRKPRRNCPAVGGAICSVCCATERERTIDCPLDCGFLRDAHQHEKAPGFDPAGLPNRDLSVTEEFMQEHEYAFILLGSAAYDAVLRFPNVIDLDLREALDALVRTYRTWESGLIYEPRPAGALAVAVRDAVQGCIEGIEQRLSEAGESTAGLDAMVLGVLVFLQHMEYAHNNGRPRSKAFVDFLRHFHVADNARTAIGQPEEPLIVL